MDTFFALLYCKVQPSRDHTVLHNDPTVLLKVNALTFDLEFFSYLLILYSGRQKFSAVFLHGTQPIVSK